MIEDFTAYLRSKAPFSNAELETITRYVQLINIKKGENLYSEGETWRYDGVVCKGLLYKHSTFVNGNVKVDSFCSENNWVGDRSSTLTGKPVPCTATALEDTTVALLKLERLTKLRIQIPNLNDVCSDLADIYVTDAKQRIANSMMLTDEERYYGFIGETPDLAVHAYPKTL